VGSDGAVKGVGAVGGMGCRDWNVGGGGRGRSEWCALSDMFPIDIAGGPDRNLDDRCLRILDGCREREL